MTEQQAKQIVMVKYPDACIWNIQGMKTLKIMYWVVIPNGRGLIPISDKCFSESDAWINAANNIINEKTKQPQI